MRFASLSIALLLVACSDGSGSRHDTGTVLSVLRGGKDCRVESRRFACADAAQHLTSELHVDFDDRITIVAEDSDRSTAAGQTIVAYELKGSGFKDVRVMAVGFITESGGKPPGGS